MKIKNNKNKKTTSLIEEYLLQQVRTGDYASICELEKNTRKTIKNTVFRRLDSKQDQEDAYQETWIKIILHIKDFKTCNTLKEFYSWVKTIARTTAIDIKRKNKVLARHKSLELPFVDLKSKLNENFLFEIEEKIQQTKIRKILNEAMAKLSKRDHLILWQWLIEIPIKKIAENMEMNPKTVKTTIHRLKKKLKIILFDKKT